MTIVRTPLSHVTLRSSLTMLLALLGAAAAGCGDSPAGPGASGRPTGTIYMNADVHSRVYSIDLGTGTVANLFEGADPCRTPEGTFIVNTGDGLAEVGADGTTRRVIVRGERYAPYEVTHDDDFHNPQLSPDGRLIAYEGQFGYVFDVYVVDRQSGALVGSYRTDDIGYGYTRPTWTADGRLVVAGATNNPGLYITDRQMTAFTRFDPNLTAPTQPIVSPDGGTVAFILNDHLYTIGIDGTGLKQITTSDWREAWPVWSPDGQWIGIYGNSSVLLLPMQESGFVDLRSLGSSVDSYLTLTSTRNGQFCWR